MQHVIEILHRTKQELVYRQRHDCRWPGSEWWRHQMETLSALLASHWSIFITKAHDAEFDDRHLSKRFSQQSIDR